MANGTTGSLDISSLNPIRLATGSFELADNFNMLSPEAKEAFTVFKILRSTGIFDIIDFGVLSSAMSN